jgi:MFS superfamily sulfate permease-like transporter
MFGLVSLEEKYNPHTTVDKIEFLVRNLGNMHHPTSVIAFTTLALLVLVRQFKRRAAMRFKWTYLIPEVLITVGLSTLFCSIWRWDLDGVPILGDVKLSKDTTYFAFPASKMNLMFFKRTTSTAMYAQYLSR